jgi:hypothetical protein
MHWSAYEVFSVLSGVAMVLLAILPNMSGIGRSWAFAGGVLFIGYGIYVAKQTSGTFVFPVWIFVIPFVAVIYLIAGLVNRARTGPDTDHSGE